MSSNFLFFGIFKPRRLAQLCPLYRGSFCNFLIKMELVICCSYEYAWKWKKIFSFDSNFRQTILFLLKGKRSEKVLFIVDCPMCILFSTLMKLLTKVYSKVKIKELGEGEVKGKWWFYFCKSVSDSEIGECKIKIESSSCGKNYGYLETQASKLKED